jgi:hypothetical protein
VEEICISLHLVVDNYFLAFIGADYWLGERKEN